MIEFLKLDKLILKKITPKINWSSEPQSIKIHDKERIEALDLYWQTRNILENHSIKAFFPFPFNGNLPGSSTLFYFSLLYTPVLLGFNGTILGGFTTDWASSTKAELVAIITAIITCPPNIKAHLKNALNDAADTIAKERHSSKEYLHINASHLPNQTCHLLINILKILKEYTLQSRIDWEYSQLWFKYNSFLNQHVKNTPNISVGTSNIKVTIY
ncbi:hypothetical protein C1646_755763 [Rhizophagus diaphanus]|nr:hypothetical protein C1646_755763 [Rhizophagus diaphanus] [Rhizophagus sp. MUCL 43196]